jgi:hypothetical protein
MNRRTRASARNRIRHAPVFEGLESRLVLSSASPSLGDGSATVDVSTFPLRFRPFTAKFQGFYTVGSSPVSGFATQFYMHGGGGSSAFQHGDIQLAFYVPTDPSQPAVGQANMMIKSITSTGDQLGADFQAVPGAVDKAGRPNQFTWEVNSNTGGTFVGAEGSGTLQLIYYPSRKVPRGATAAGRIGVIFRGSVGVTNINDITRNS